MAKNEKPAPEEMLAPAKAEDTSPISVGAYNLDLDDERLEEDLQANSWLPRLDLVGSKSAIRNLPKPCWALFYSKDNFKATGDRCTVIPFHYRRKAIDYQQEPLLTSFIPDCDIYKDIKARSQEQDSGCAEGVEFLVWVCDFKVMATLFFKSKSFDRMMQDFKDALTALKTGNLGSAALTLGHRVAEKAKKKQSWDAPCVVDLIPEAVNWPAAKVVNTSIEKMKEEAAEEMAAMQSAAAAPANSPAR